MTAGGILIASLLAIDVLMTGYAIIGLGKIRMDQQVGLGILKWLWQKELKKEMKERKT